MTTFSLRRVLVIALLVVGTFVVSLIQEECGALLIRLVLRVGLASPKYRWVADSAVHAR
jgi:hypothetical protein